MDNSIQPLSKTEQIKHWWDRPTTQMRAAVLSRIASAILGAVVITGAALNLKGIHTVVGVKIDNTLLMKIGAYGALALIMGKKFKDTAHLQKLLQQSQENDVLNSLDQVQEGRCSLALVSMLALLGVGTIVGLTIGQTILKNRVFSMDDLVNILLPVVTLVALTTSNQKEVELQIRKQEIVKSEKSEDVNEQTDLNLTTAEKVKKAANFFFLSLSIGSLLVLGAAATALYGWKIKNINVLGTAIPLNLNQLRLLGASGAALGAVSIKNILFTRSEEELNRERTGIQKPEDISNVRNELEVEKKKAMIRQAVGALLIAVGLIGIGASIWSLFPGQMKRILGVNIQGNLLGVTIASLTSLGFVSSGIDLFAEEAINYERAEQIAYLTTQATGNLEMFYQTKTDEEN